MYKAGTSFEDVVEQAAAWAVSPSSNDLARYLPEIP